MNATSDQRDSIDRYVQSLPEPQQIRERLSENLREQRLLKQLLKLAEQREKVAEARRDG